MFTAYAGMNRMRANYQDVDLSSRVEGASPHQLIAILYDELLKALDTLAAAVERREMARMSTTQARALSIVGGLQASLDMERGGDLARNLSDVYREARRLVQASVRDTDVAHVRQARAMLAEIASAWNAIGERPVGD